MFFLSISFAYHLQLAGVSLQNLIDLIECIDLDVFFFLICMMIQLVLTSVRREYGISQEHVEI